MTKFNQEEEQFLLDLIKLRALIGRPMGASDLMKTGKELLIAKGGNESKVTLPSKSWAHQFLKRYNDQIGMKIGKLLSKSRVKGMPRENFDDFYHLLKIIIENTNLKDELLLLAKVIFNCNETGISLRPRQVKFIIPRGQ